MPIDPAVQSHALRVGETGEISSAKDESGLKSQSAPSGLVWVIDEIGGDSVASSDTQSVKTKLSSFINSRYEEDL